MSALCQLVQHVQPAILVWYRWSITVSSMQRIANTSLATARVGRKRLADMNGLMLWTHMQHFATAVVIQLQQYKAILVVGHLEQSFQAAAL